MVRQMIGSASLLVNLDPDKVLEGFGKYGRYQLCVYIMASMSFVIFSYLTTIISLIGEPPEECDNNTVSLLNVNLFCILYNPKKQVSVNGLNYSTLATTYGIDCKNADILDHASGAFMLGNFITTPISTYLADRYGRRLIFMIPLWLSIVLSVACAFAPNYTLFLLFRFLTGACGAAIGVVGFVLTVESVAGSFRSIQALLNSLIWVTGIFAVGILHLFIGNWRYLYGCIAVPGIFSILYYWFFPESLHWLIANKKTKGIHRYILKSSKMNKMTLNLDSCQQSEETADENDAQMASSCVGKPKPKRTFLDLLKSPALLFHLLLNCYIFVVLNFVYWVLTLYSVDMHESKMVGFFLSAAVEVPAGILAMLLLLWCGRRTVSILSLFGQSCAIGLTILTPQGSTLNLVLSLFAKILNTVAWASAPLLLSEMAPTTVRNMCYGVVATSGEIGSVLAPYLNRIGDENMQKAAITSMSILAILFSMAAPETNGKALPQDLDDFDSGPFLRTLSRFWKRLWAGNRNRSPAADLDEIKRDSSETMAMQKAIEEEV